MSAYIDGEMVSPVDMLNAPCSTDSAVSLRISASSSGVGARESASPTANRRAEWPTCGATLMLRPFSSSLFAQPSRSVQSHSTDETWDLSTASLPIAPTGYGEMPQFPTTSVVTPWYTLLSPPGSSRSVLSECECMSMKPGATICPDASMTRSATASSRLPIAAILSPVMPTSAA